jgi:hypothetical protein
MFVGKECVEGEVAVDEEASPVMSKVATIMKDVEEVVKAAAMGACSVVRGSGAVAEGIVPLK